MAEIIKGEDSETLQKWIWRGGVFLFRHYPKDEKRKDTVVLNVPTARFEYDDCDMVYALNAAWYDGKSKLEIQCFEQKVVRSILRGTIIYPAWMILTQLTEHEPGELSVARLIIEKDYTRHQIFPDAYRVGDDKVILGDMSVNKIPGYSEAKPWDTAINFQKFAVVGHENRRPLF